MTSTRFVTHTAMMGALVLRIGCGGNAQPSPEEPIPLQEGDKVEAARLLVTWAIKGHSAVSVENEKPAGSAAAPRILLTCDFVPLPQLLTLDPRLKALNKDNRPPEEKIWEGVSVLRLELLS